jgi:hypothetical protein
MTKWVLEASKRARRVLLGLAVAGISCAASGAGNICIGSVPKAAAGQKSSANATASAVPFEFEVIIGKSAPIATSHVKSQLIADMDTTKAHRVIIRQRGQQVASFHFWFREYKSENLCLWFKPSRESWSMVPLAQSRGKCACEKPAV